MPEIDVPPEHDSDCSCDPCLVSRGLATQCTCCAYIFTYPPDDPDGNLCDSCYDDCRDRYDSDDDSDTTYLHNYNYTPTLNFLRLPDDPDDKLFLGVELEVPSNEDRELSRVIYDNYGDREELLYCKEDGSITGVEIVSHPMTHAYFSEHFPFKMFRGSSAATPLLSSRRPGVGYGMHVHVSRDAFADEAHTLRWLLLIYRNRDDVANLARRTNDQWTSFSDIDVCPDKARGGKGRARYVAVNAQNDQTLEVRVFRSTWNEREFRAAVDFVHASVIYAGQLDTADATAGGLTWARFRKWLEGKPQYSNLVAEMDKHEPAPEIVDLVPVEVALNPPPAPPDPTAYARWSLASVVTELAYYVRYYAGDTYYDRNIAELRLELSRRGVDDSGNPLVVDFAISA